MVAEPLHFFEINHWNIFEQHPKHDTSTPKKFREQVSPRTGSSGLRHRLLFHLGHSHAGIAHRTWRRFARLQHVLHRAPAWTDCLADHGSSLLPLDLVPQGRAVAVMDGFFAATMSALVLVTLPALIAAYLPLLKAVNLMTSH
jgi:hypothetical protein